MAVNKLLIMFFFVTSAHGMDFRNFEADIMAQAATHEAESLTAKLYLKTINTLINTGYKQDTSIDWTVRQDHLSCSELETQVERFKNLDDCIAMEFTLSKNFYSPENSVTLQLFGWLFLRKSNDQVIYVSFISSGLCDGDGCATSPNLNPN